MRTCNWCDKSYAFDGEHDELNAFFDSLECFKLALEQVEKEAQAIDVG